MLPSRQEPYSRAAYFPILIDRAAFAYAARGHLYRRRTHFRQEHFSDLREFHGLDHKTASPLAKHNLRQVPVGLTRARDSRYTRTYGLDHKEYFGYVDPC